MSVPSVVVDGAPEGWRHIGSPSRHLHRALDEGDEQTIAETDAGLVVDTNPLNVIDRRTNRWDPSVIEIADTAV